MYGVASRGIELLDAVSDAAVTGYRIEAESGTYFLKLRNDPPPPPLARYLADAGIGGVLAPIQPRHEQVVTRLAGRTAILYPYVQGENAFRRPLSRQQWTALGAIVRAIHDATLPPSISHTVRRETYADDWRTRARRYLADVPRGGPDDAVARELTTILGEKREQIESLARHAERLAEVLLRRRPPVVPCHGDLHAGNVLVDDAGALTIVDWDDPVLAPRERDLMFVGAGIGRAWNRPEESDAFYRGYGEIAVDAEALAYYRCERFIEDVATFCDQLLLPGGDEGDADRRESLRRFSAAFDRNDVVDIAERTFARL